MRKRLVVCCDGTWNTPDQKSKGTPAITNVARLALSTPAVARDGREQAVYYDKGVGTGKFELLLGGLFGIGLSRNIREAYSFLIQSYAPGDEIFLFGFSRGAYTVRSLGGLIRNSGLLKRQFAEKIREAYNLYRKPGEDGNPRSNEMTLFRKSFSYEPRIHFIGVWDTVGALGIPRLINIPFLSRHWTFHDVKLSTHVDNAFHALAIDEHRRPFAPTLWEQQTASLARQGRTQRFEQVWFAGAHSDVGGGYPADESGLADLAFTWMATRASECGLDISVSPAGATIDPVHDSMSVWYKSIDRKINSTGQESVHASVWQRLKKDPGYRPTNLRAYFTETISADPT